MTDRKLAGSCGFQLQVKVATAIIENLNPEKTQVVRLQF